MLRKSLISEFNCKLNNTNNNYSDYEIFKDKNELDELRKKILEKLGDLTYLNGDITKPIILDVINELTVGYNLTNLERSHLYNIIDNEIYGYGPLTELLNDPNVNEIMVNSPNEIYISLNGKFIKDESVSFINDDHIIRTIKKLLKGTNIDYDNESIINAKVNDDATISIVKPPISSKGVVLTIKKINKSLISMDELLRIGSLTPYMARFLEAGVLAKLNILVVGSQASGKTSLINALGNLTLNDTRIVTIENILEFNVNKNNIIHLNTDSSIDILSEAIKMHPETLIIGEIKNDMIYPVIDIMKNNNLNVLTSIKANDAIDAIKKIENYGIINDDLTSDVIRDNLYRAIDLMVTIKEMPDYKHKIVSICEFNKNKNDQIVLKEIFSFNDGEYALNKYIPDAYKKIKSRGINLVDDIFK